jgi:NAD(P)-dependent dehydrogenase (short-subunit alcohol dehydrogenase family)
MAKDHTECVLVTGCSTGIGRATALHLARRGRTVYATARRPETLDELAEAGCRILALDVCDESSMATAVEAVEADEGAVGALVNNAGYSLSGPIEQVPIDDVRRQFETNVFGLVRMCQLVLPGMRRQRWGRIVNLSSVGGRLTFPGLGFYHATKYSVEALSDALRYEVRPWNVHVVIVEPGLIRTSFGDTATATLEESTSREGPYASFNEGVAKTVAGSYEGLMGRFSTGPESAAKVIERAIDRPKPRYKVTIGAHAIVATKKLTPDRAFDFFLRSQFPSPKPD